MAKFFFSGNTKVTFTPIATNQERPFAIGRPMTDEEQACDCGCRCQHVWREPGADLTYYREPDEPRPAGVSPGYLVLRSGGVTEVANFAMIHDGEGRWVGDVDQDSWRTVGQE